MVKFRAKIFQFIGFSNSGKTTIIEEVLKYLISNGNEVSVIKKKGKITTIFSANHITGVLISKAELNYFKYNLKRLVLKIEDVYKSILINWNGDLTLFHSIKNIINEIFSV